MSALQSSRGHVVIHLQIPACPLILSPMDRMASSLSCRMLCNVARATMMFSWRTASVLIDARTSASPLSVRVPPAARVRSRLRSSSPHSNSCATTSAPVNAVPSLYSFQRVTKYAHSSPVPASNTDGRFSLSARALVDGAIAVAVCAVAWMFRRAAVTTASLFSASNVQSGNGHLTYTML